MDSAEIEQYLGSSLAHSIVVDVRELGELPGYLRTVTIHQDLRVSIEVLRCNAYATADWEGGNPKFVGRYETLDRMVAALEEYLSAPIAQWTNFTRTPYQPSSMREPDADASIAQLEDLVRQRRIPLPNGARFLNMTLPWRHLERYGEFRPDKLGEEQELLWHEGVEAGLYEPDE